jgi:hypothetical protein
VFEQSILRDLHTRHRSCLPAGSGVHLRLPTLHSRQDVGSLIVRHARTHWLFHGSRASLRVMGGGELSRWSSELMARGAGALPSEPRHVGRCLKSRTLVGLQLGQCVIRSAIEDVGSALIRQAESRCRISSGSSMFCIPSCTAIFATSQCGDPCHETWLLPLLLHLRMPICLSLCSVALDPCSVPAHEVATHREKNCIDGNPSEQNAKIAPDMGLLKIEKC